MIFSVFTISGHSMMPNFSPGDKIITSKIPYWFCAPKIDDIIVFWEKKRGMYFIKRIKRIKKEKYFVEGDNKLDSLDSKKIGSITKKDILAKVIFTIRI